MAEVRASIGSSNDRRSSYTIDRFIPYRYWPNRRPYLAQALKDAKVSIIGTQECTKEQSHDITHDLGPNWTYFGGDGDGNSPVLWDGLKWDAADAFEKPIDAPGARFKPGQAGPSQLRDTLYAMIRGAPLSGPPGNMNAPWWDDYYNVSAWTMREIYRATDTSNAAFASAAILRSHQPPWMRSKPSGAITSAMWRTATAPSGM